MDRTTLSLHTVLGIQQDPQFNKPHLPSTEELALVDAFRKRVNGDQWRHVEGITFSNIAHA